MKISIKKENKKDACYTITRTDGSNESIHLDTKTYFIHDITHYVVEQKMSYHNGFWGLLSQGYRFDQLFGKENTIIQELKYIEKIVGPIQSIIQGFTKKEDFVMHTSYLEIDTSMTPLDDIIMDINAIIHQWKSIPIGEQIDLVFNP